MKFKWSVSTLDWDGPFGWQAVTSQQILQEIVPKLHSYETMEWGVVEGPSGSHFIEVGKLSKAAQDRLAEIDMNDIDEIFSLRMQGAQRIFGVRDVATLRMLWWDPDHGVCPAPKKHT